MRLLKKPKKQGIVRNVRKVEDDSIIFDSRLEWRLYRSLKDNNISFTLKPKYTIVDGFRYNSELIRPITLTPDFELDAHNIIVDTKGYQTPESAIKFKLLKRHLRDEGRNPKVYLVKTQGEIPSFINAVMTNSIYVAAKPKKKKSK